MRKEKTFTRWCASQKSWFTISYYIDWLVAVAIIILDISFTEFIFNPYERLLPNNTTGLDYPAVNQIIPWWLFIFITVFLPFSAFSIFQIALKSLHDFHHACLGLIETVAINLVFTDSIQFLSGEYRPDWYNRVRAGVPRELKDGRLSFPSGYASLVFATMTYLSLYIGGKFGVLRKDGGQMWKVIIMLLPYGGAIIVSLSATMDYRNNFVDIVGGMSIGCFVGMLCYFLNFYSLFGKNSHLPKSRRYMTKMRQAEKFLEEESMGVLSVNVDEM